MTSRSRHSSKSRTRGDVRPKSPIGVSIPALSEVPADFEKRNLFRDTFAALISALPAKQLARVISYFTFAGYSREEIELRVFTSDDLSRFPYRGMMKRGLRAPASEVDSILSKAGRDSDATKNAIEAFATRLICWAPDMAVRLVAASDADKATLVDAYQQHYDAYISVISNGSEIATEFAEQLLDLQRSHPAAARALLQGDLGAALAAFPDTKSRMDKVKVFETAEAVWCCFDLQWIMAFWRQKYRNGLSFGVFSSKVHQSVALVSEFFSLFDENLHLARSAATQNKTMSMSRAEEATFDDLVRQLKSISNKGRGDVITSTILHPVFSNALDGLNALAPLLRANQGGYGESLFLEDVSLANAMFAAALRFHQAERTRKQRVVRILSTGRARGLGAYDLKLYAGRSSRLRPVLKRSQEIAITLRRGIGDRNVSNDFSFPPFRPQAADWQQLNALLSYAANPPDEFEPLMGRPDQKALMDVLDQSMHIRWRQPQEAA